MRISDWSSDVCSSDLQQRPDVLRRRRAWLELQPELDPDRLVFIDETGTSTKMARRCGRSPRGERCRAPRSEEHTSELQSLMRISYAVFCLKKKKNKKQQKQTDTTTTHTQYEQI